METIQSTGALAVYVVAELVTKLKKLINGALRRTFEGSGWVDLAGSVCAATQPP